MDGAFLSSSEGFSQSQVFFTPDMQQEEVSSLAQQREVTSGKPWFSKKQRKDQIDPFGIGCQFFLKYIISVQTLYLIL